jgi:hypothetical protein
VEIDDLVQQLHGMSKQLTDIAAQLKSMKVSVDQLPAIKANVSELKNEVTTHNLAISRLEKSSSSDGKKPDESDAENSKAPSNPNPKQCRDEDCYQLRYAKLDFPKFDGICDPLPWLNKCKFFFRGVCTAEDKKVWIASLHMEDGAHQWYFRLERDQGIPT